MNSKIDKQDRLVVYPIKHPDIWNQYKKHLMSFWTVEELDFSKDYNHWQTLNKNEQHFIKYVLGFFAASDGIVNINLVENFIDQVEILEAKIYYRFQATMEDIHAECYSLMIDTYIKDDNEKNELLNAIETIPCIRQKADWAIKWIDNDRATYAQRLIAFACVEGIFFSGSFCAIFWLKKRGLMPGLTFSNELISRDEGLHTDFAIELYSLLENKLNENTFYELVKDAVEIEKEFITESLPCNLIGMNAELMKQYIEFVADRLIVQFGYEKIYNVENPFEFMELISMRNKTNFFEKRVGEYGKAGVAVEDNNMELDLEADF